MDFPFIGYAHGDARPTLNPVYSAELRSNLQAVARALDDLATKRLQATAEIAVRQTIADIVFGVSEFSRPEFVVRSSIADGKRCEVCLSLHGLVIATGSPEYAKYDPQNPDNPCIGVQHGHRCRCVYAPLPAGGSGWELTGYVTDSTIQAVRGEIVLQRTGAPDPQYSQSILAIAKTKKRPHEEDRAQMLSVSEEIQLREAERIIRAAATDGKPKLAHNVLAALQYWARTGEPPPYARRSDRPLVFL